MHEFIIKHKRLPLNPNVKELFLEVIRGEGQLQATMCGEIRGLQFIYDLQFHPKLGMSLFQVVWRCMHFLTLSPALIQYCGTHNVFMHN